MTRICGVMLAVLLCGQLADAQDRRPFGPPVGPCDCNPNCNGRTFVLIAPGSSEYLDVQERLNDALEFNPCPIVTRVVNWATLEYSSYNYQSQGVQVLGAARMAGQVMKLRQCYPANPIVLLGWEAGARVVLLAAEQLPPGIVDRIILLSPAVSACYDVRCALKASKCGIDMYYSSDDPQLAEKEATYGSADGGMRGPLAGRIGFLIKCKGPLAGDPILMGLRQFDVARCEFLGDTGEYTTLNRSFMRRYVVPLLPCGVICGGFGPPPVPPPFPPQGPPPPSGPYPPQGPNGPPPPPPPMSRTPNGPLPPLMPMPPLNRTTTTPPPAVGPAALQGTNATTAANERTPALPPPPTSGPALPPPPTPPVSGPALPPPPAN